MAIAKVLGVSIDLLEAFVADDEKENKEIILFELRGDSVAARFLREYNSLIDRNE